MTPSGQPIDWKNRVPLPERKWYVAMTAARQEAKASRKLSRAGYWTWYPFERVRQRRRRGNHFVVEWVEKAHFPGYVFFALRFEGETLEPTFWIDEVVDIVRRPLSREPMRIPGPVMDRLESGAMVRLGDKNFIAALMREVILEEQAELRKSVGEGGKLRIAASNPKRAKREPDIRPDLDMQAGRIRVGLLR